MANPISKLNLVINGVTTQLDVHDPNALTTEIDSIGTDWVRFKSGLQICWGECSKTSVSDVTINFPKAFIPGYPLSVSVSGQSSTIYALGWSVNKVVIGNSNAGEFTYTAVGRWK